MKFIHSVLLLLATLLVSLPSHAATCKGKFANPITDICWSCMFPLRIAGTVSYTHLRLLPGVA